MTTATATATALTLVSDTSKLTVQQMVEVSSTLPFIDQWERLLDKERGAKDDVKMLEPKNCLKQLKDQLKALTYLDIPFSQKESLEKGIRKQEAELKADYAAAIKRLRTIRAAKAAYKAYAKYVTIR